MKRNRTEQNGAIKKKVGTGPAQGLSLVSKERLFFQGIKQNGTILKKSMNTSSPIITTTLC